MSVYEFRVPLVVYYEETHLVFADNEEQAREKLKRYGNHAAYGRKELDHEFLYSDAELMEVDLEPPSCYECPFAFETNGGDAACSLTLDDNGFRLCDDMAWCPKDDSLPRDICHVTPKEALPKSCPERVLYKPTV